jgi:hypothetical protein
MRGSAAQRRQFSPFELDSVIEVSRALRAETRQLRERSKSIRAALITTRLRAQAALSLSQEIYAELLGRLTACSESSKAPITIVPPCGDGPVVKSGPPQ